MKTIIEIGILLVAIGCVWFFISTLRRQKEKIKDKEAFSLCLEKVINKLIPDNPCMAVSPESGIHCMKSATHIYAGVALCSECAQKLVVNGANPLPVRFDFELQRVCF